TALAAATQPPAAEPPATALSEADLERILLPIRSEMRTLRTMLKPVMTPQTDGLRAEIEALRREIAARASAAPTTPATHATPAIDEAMRAPNLAAPSNGRVVALIGPTGVGKTTTIAKLAARAALVERKRVAIVTLDAYRVGGEEQVRTFADLMGVPLHLVTDPADLGAKLDELRRNHDRIFIDTSGHSPRDTASIKVLENAFAKAGQTAAIEVHLTVPAGLPVSTVESIFRRYRALNPARLLFTKLDEADDLGTIVH